MVDHLAPRGIFQEVGFLEPNPQQELHQKDEHEDAVHHTKGLGRGSRGSRRSGCESASAIPAGCPSFNPIDLQ